MIVRRRATIRLTVALLAALLPSASCPQQIAPAANPGVTSGDPKFVSTTESHALSPGELFSARAQMLLGAGQTSKGEWGLLISDAKTGEVLFEQNADRYFVPASNMKLFTTALALATLGRDYRFRTTL